MSESKAYDIDKMRNQALDAIEKHKLNYINDIFAFVPYSKNTFYSKSLNKDDSIIKKIEDNRVSIKVNLKNQWAKSKSPFLQQMLFRLLADEDELMRLRTSDKQQSDSDKNYTELMKENAELKKKLTVLENKKK